MLLHVNSDWTWEEQRIEYRIASAGKRQRWYTSCELFFWKFILSLYVRYESLAGITLARLVNAFSSPVKGAGLLLSSCSGGRCFEHYLKRATSKLQSHHVRAWDWSTSGGLPPSIRGSQTDTEITCHEIPIETLCSRPRQTD